MTFKGINTGRISGIGPSGYVQLPEYLCQDGVRLLAGNNTSDIYIGESGHTVDSNDDTDGYPLASGENIFIPIRHSSDVYIQSALDTNQKLWWLIQ